MLVLPGPEVIQISVLKDDLPNYPPWVSVPAGMWGL